jgi:hypothetical protein
MDGFARFVPPLARLPVEASLEEQLRALRRDGVLIIENALSPQQLDQLSAELNFWFEVAPGGEGAFFGRRTRRFGALLRKARSALDLVLHPRILPLCERVLIGDDIGPPRCDRIQLNITQGIGIGPDEPEQVVHRDEKLFWVTPGHELLVNALYCLDDFTAQNGGTRFVPGSSYWEDAERWPEPHEIVQAEAKAGSAILWLGSMMHGGGANRTDKVRRGAVVSYNLGGWRKARSCSCPFRPSWPARCPNAPSNSSATRCIARPWAGSRDAIRSSGCEASSATLQRPRTICRMNMSPSLRAITTGAPPVREAGHEPLCSGRDIAGRAGGVETARGRGHGAGRRIGS